MAGSRTAFGNNEIPPQGRASTATGGAERTTQTPRTSVTQHVLLVRAGSWTCALPITDVVETMRALPTRPIAGAPLFVRGVSIIRGGPLPVVDLGALLGAPPIDEGGRFVTVRTGSRQFALLVAQVIGAKHIDEAALSLTPPLLSEALPAHAEKIGALDGQMVALLRIGRVLPNDVWGRMLSEGEGQGEG